MSFRCYKYISSLKSPTMHAGISFSFETMFNSSSVNLDIGVDGGLYTDKICSFVGSEIFTASIHNHSLVQFLLA